MKSNRLSRDVGWPAREGGRFLRARVLGAIAAIALIAAPGAGIAQDEIQPTDGAWVAGTLFPDLSGQEITFMGNGGEVQNLFQSLMQEFFRRPRSRSTSATRLFTKIQAQVEPARSSMISSDHSVTVPNCGCFDNGHQPAAISNAVDEARAPIVAYVFP